MIVEKNLLIKPNEVFEMVYLCFHDVNGGFGGVEMGRAALFA